MKGYALNKWKSTLNFVFMPMETMQTVSEASCKVIFHLYNSFGILNLNLAVMVRPYCHVLIYLKGIHSRPRQFLTRLKYLLSQVNDPVLLLSCSAFEFYPVVSRGCLAIAPHLTNFVEIIPFLVIITPRVLGLLSTENPDWKIYSTLQFNTPCNCYWECQSQSGYSQTIGYILVSLSLTVLHRPSLVRNLFIV